jgi:DNA-binding response OmpR family regulator
VQIINNGENARRELQTGQYDLIVLDWMLPGLSGLDVCREYRNAGGSTPIIMLTGRISVNEKETGLDSGADDYLTKPFNLRELGARIKGLLRRPASVQASESISLGNLTLESSQYRATLKGKSYQLSADEFHLLSSFMRRPNETFSTSELLNRVWSGDSAASGAIVEKTWQGLKQKFDADGEFLRVVDGGGGYRLDVP